MSRSHARADGVTADLKGTVSNEKRETGTHMHVDTLNLELTIKKVRMHIAKVFKNNRILSESRRSISTQPIVHMNNCFRFQPKRPICFCAKTDSKC